MRVLYVVPAFPTNSITFTTNEMLALRACGMEIDIAPLWQEIEPLLHLSAADAQLIDRVIRLRLSSPAVWRGALGELLRQPGLLLLIARVIPHFSFSLYALLKLSATVLKGLALGAWARQQRIDHIHAHFLSSPALVAMLAAAAAQIPYTATAHAFDIFQHSGKHRRTALRLKCERAAAIVAISAFNRQHLLEQHPGLQARIDVIPNGIDLDLFTLPADKAPSGMLRILSVGRLVTKKGHEYLIRAVARLRHDGLPATLTLVGGGDLEAPLRSLAESLGIADEVEFVGALPEEQTVSYYGAADLFALACVPLDNGDMDGLPTVLIEALAMKLPTVSTTVSGIPEIVQDGVTGRCVSPFDVEALAAAIRWLFEHPAEAQAQAQRGRALVEAQYDRRKNAARLAALLAEIHRQ
jgi:glycosyltransferase involved in cell wall biosynthesis